MKELAVTMVWDMTIRFLVITAASLLVMGMMGCEQPTGPSDSWNYINYRLDCHTSKQGLCLCVAHSGNSRGGMIAFIDSTNKACNESPNITDR